MELLFKYDGDQGGKSRWKCCLCLRFHTNKVPLQIYLLQFQHFAIWKIIFEVMLYTFYQSYQFQALLEQAQTQIYPSLFIFQSRPWIYFRLSIRVCKTDILVANGCLFLTTLDLSFVGRTMFRVWSFGEYLLRRFYGFHKVPNASHLFFGTDYPGIAWASRYTSKRILYLETLKWRTSFQEYVFW